jgi:Ca2+-binding EF-hand superfamily protein
MDDYLDYFGFNGVSNRSDDCARKAAVVDMFKLRDKDGNGVLTLEEIEEMIDDDAVFGYGV